MKTIIAGSRSIESYDLVRHYIQELDWTISEVVCGCAQGVDSWGEMWALENNIPIKYFKADWFLGRKAGPIRNKAMAEYADALLLIWDGKSNGSRDMLRIARETNLSHIMEVQI